MRRRHRETPSGLAATDTLHISPPYCTSGHHARSPSCYLGPPIVRDRLRGPSSFPVLCRRISLSRSKESRAVLLVVRSRSSRSSRSTDGWVTPASIRVIELRRSALRWFLQNPDKPLEKPTLQSYQIDLGQCGPMVLDALVRPPLPVTFPFKYRLAQIDINTDQDQERTRPDSHFPSIMPRRYLRFMRYEHRRFQHLGLYLSNRPERGQAEQNLPVAAQCVAFHIDATI